MHQSSPETAKNSLFFSDTAYNYNTEESIGKALKTWLDSGKVKREELFITTKVSAQSTTNSPQP